MDMLRFSGLERSYGAREIFSGLDGVLRDGDKVGLVGPNGAGKSSLVRLLVGLDEGDGGSIVRARDARLGYLSQAASADDAVTLRAILERAFARMHAEEARVRELETALSQASHDGDSEREAKLLHAYGEAREVFDRHGGEGNERVMLAMLAEFGFDESDLDRPPSAFSGGQRTRAALARMLLEEPDYLVLDEPTNHLDIETVRWLEDFLVNDPRATLVVSHDRYFLDRVANRIWELDGGKLESYDVKQGRAYAAYVDEKAARLEQAERDYEKFRDEEKRRKAVVAELKTHGSHNYSHVRSREKALAKMERVEAPKTTQTKISVKLEAARRATNGLALKARDLRVAYSAPLFDGLTFAIGRGERLVVVGANGAGKSTLLGVLSGKRAPDRGEVEVMAGVKTAYFSQDSTDDLPAGVSAVDAVLVGASVTPEEARSLLGRLGLTGDAGDKPVDAFSGGERRRIMLARLMARSADLLFLDEPTNDLDIPSQEALEAVLSGYVGAMIVVSHDRYLLRRLAERVLWLHDGTASIVEGGYDVFESHARAKTLAAIADEKAATKTVAKAAKPVVAVPQPPAATPAPRDDAKRRDKRARDVAAAEREVARLDEKRVALETEFADPAIYDDRVRVAQLEAELAAAREAVDTAFARWERLAQDDAVPA
ncbi:MAG: ABC-F family ATP-binding cassette domain-containing protein [Vulcanimicrobiaceae bacterium]